MEAIIDAYQKLKYLTDDYDFNTTERLKEYADELAVPPSFQNTSPQKEKKGLQNRESFASSSSSSISSVIIPHRIAKSYRESLSDESVSKKNSFHAKPLPIQEVDEGNRSDDEKEDSILIGDKFHIRNNSLFNDNGTTNELIELLTSLSNEEIQPFVAEIEPTTHHIDEELQYEQSYDYFLELIDKMKSSNSQRVQRLVSSLQLLINRQREIIHVIVEKFKQDFGYYRMKTRFLELMNQINKYSMKLSELRYELSLKQEEFNSSAEDLRLRYEQELESLIRKLIATIEDKKLEISNLQAKQNSIQADITRICNELSLLLHELEKKEKNKNYLQLFSAKRGVPEIKNITNEKIEAALSTESSKIVDGSPSKGDQSSTGKMKNTKQKKFLGNVSGGSKSNKIINHLSKVTINKSEDSPMNSTLDSQAIQESSTVSTLPDNVLNDDNDPNYIFTVFPFLDTNEITEEMVLESLKITDKLLMDFEDKKRDLSIQEEKVNSEKNKIQNLLRSEENKALERLKLTVNNLQEKIESDGKRGELLQTLIKNLSSEGKVTHRKSKLLTPSISIKDRKGNEDSKPAENKTEIFTMDQLSQPSEPSKGQLKVSTVPVLNEIEHNVIKYQELFEKCHTIIQTEREKVISRGRSREAVMENAPTNFKPFNPSNDSSKLNFKENYHADSNYRSEQRAQIAALEHKRNIKRIIVPHQISKIHKAIEMFDYYANLPELSEIEKIQNTLLPYTNFPMSRSANRASATDDLKKGSTSQKQSLPSSPLNKSRPLSQKSVTFTSIEEVQFKAENADFGMLPTTHQQSSQGRRSAISSRSSIRSKSPELLAALSATVDQFNKQFSGEKVLQTPSTTPKSRGYQLTLKMEEQENRQFFLQDYGFKLALEQISSIYNLLLKWNHPGSANPSLLNGNIVVQTDQEENNLVTIELLKSQIEQLLAKIKSLYRQNTYYNSIIKDLSKDLVSNMKKSSTLQTELYSEIRDIKWNQNSLPGKYQMEMDILKERILTLKKECKVWEDKVAKRRLTNIRLSQMLSESSKTVRRSLPVKNQIKMVPAILKDSYPLEKLLSIEEPADANYRSISDDHNYGKPGTSNTQFSDLGVDVEPSTLTPRAPDILKMGSSLDEPSLPDISISR